MGSLHGTVDHGITNTGDAILQWPREPERFTVSSSGGLAFEREWTEPYAGEYRIGTLLDLDVEDDGTLALVYSDPFTFDPS